MRKKAYLMARININNLGDPEINHVGIYSTDQDNISCGGRYACLRIIEGIDFEEAEQQIIDEIFAYPHNEWMRRYFNGKTMSKAMSDFLIKSRGELGYLDLQAEVIYDQKNS